MPTQAPDSLKSCDLFCSLSSMPYRYAPSLKTKRITRHCPDLCHVDYHMVVWLQGQAARTELANGDCDRPTYRINGPVGHRTFNEMDQTRKPLDSFVGSRTHVPLGHGELHEVSLQLFSILVETIVVEQPEKDLATPQQFLKPL